MSAISTKSKKIPNTRFLGFLLERRLQSKEYSEQGFSLLEALMAIAVIAVVISTFTPPIFLAVGTRIQNRRAEQAIQLAQAEVDRVRRLVERGQYEVTGNTDPAQKLPPIGDANVREQSKPTDSTDNFANITATKGLKVDVNNDGIDDFVVQSFRNTGIVRNNKTIAFCMGVRVFAYSAAQNNFAEVPSVPRQTASLNLTSAIGSQRRLPLAAMYTSVVRSDVENSLYDYQSFLTTTSRCN